MVFSYLGKIGSGVIDIIFPEKEGPSSNNEGAYCIVDIPHSTIPVSLVPHLGTTCIPIPMIQSKCERKCCTMTTFPIRVCVALTIHKAQGMTIGEGELFNKVIIYFPNPTDKLVPGLMLVAFSRAKKCIRFCSG